jgi:hypothetical protein
MSETNALTLQQGEKPNALPVTDTSSFSNLLDTNRFNHIWRVANVFAASGLVPKQFHNNPAGCFVGVQMALRLNVDPFMFLQNIYMSPDGKPALYGQMAIALINTSGRLDEPLDLIVDGEGDHRGCTAIGMLKGGTKRELRVDIATAKAEGWFNRNPKWKNMPDQMLRYRAGAWWGRAYCPEALMGMQTAEELQDIEMERQRDGSWSVAQQQPKPTSLGKLDTLASGQMPSGWDDAVSLQAEPAQQQEETPPPAQSQSQSQKPTAKKQAQQPEVPPADPPHDPETGEIHDEQNPPPADDEELSFGDG